MGILDMLYESVLIFNGFRGRVRNFNKSIKKIIEIPLLVGKYVAAPAKVDINAC